jgi:hypothetical protein
VQFFQQPGLLGRLKGAGSAREVAEILNERLLAAEGKP